MGLQNFCLLVVIRSSADSFLLPKIFRITDRIKAVLKLWFLSAMCFHIVYVSEVIGNTSVNVFSVGVA